MTELAVVLEEGFDDDEVAVRFGDELAFSGRVTTRPQIGVAKRFTVDVPRGPVVLNVEVASRDLAADVPVDVRDGTHVGISIAGDQVVHRSADEPFRYA